MNTLLFPRLDTLPVYDEKTIPEPGWYWHVPTGGIPHNRPKFMEVDADSLDGSLHCKQYQGTYTGPIAIPGEETITDRRPLPLLSDDELNLVRKGLSELANMRMSSSMPSMRESGLKAHHLEARFDRV